MFGRKIGPDVGVKVGVAVLVSVAVGRGEVGRGEVVPGVDVVVGSGVVVVVGAGVVWLNIMGRNRLEPVNISANPTTPKARMRAMVSTAYLCPIVGSW